MSMKCDRCGEAFEYYDNTLCGNSIRKTLVNESKRFAVRLADQHGRFPLVDGR